MYPWWTLVISYEVKFLCLLMIFMRNLIILRVKNWTGENNTSMQYVKKSIIVLFIVVHTYTCCVYISNLRASLTYTYISIYTDMRYSRSKMGQHWNAEAHKPVLFTSLPTPKQQQQTGGYTICAAISTFVEYAWILGILSTRWS